MNYKADAFDYQQEYEKLKAGVDRANVLILGASGAGKSSVINHLFGQVMTATGEGQAVTRGILPCRSADMPLCIYDTEGYLTGEDAMQQFERSILSFVDTLHADASTQASSRIHIAWCCISLASKRVNEADMRLVRQLRDRGIPVCVALTQADSVDADELSAMQRALSDRLPDVPHFVTCALPEMQETLRDYLQWDELLSWSLDNMDASLHEGFISSLHLELERKRKLVSDSILPRYIAGAAAIGAVPLPFSDAVLLVPLQTTMTLHILNAYGVEKISQTVSGLVGSMIMTQIGQSTAGALFKLLPGVGSIVGGTLTATVAGTLTGALGYAILELSHLYAYKVLVEHENMDAIDWFNPAHVEKLVREYLQRNKKKQRDAKHE